MTIVHNHPSDFSCDDTCDVIRAARAEALDTVYRALQSQLNPPHDFPNASWRRGMENACVVVEGIRFGPASDMAVRSE